MGILMARRKRERDGRPIRTVWAGAGPLGRARADRMVRLAVAHADPLTIVRLRRRRDTLVGEAEATS
ncbi:MAG TPA: hypothetical protein VKZ50_01950 [bacterium]|nr:hypothetical protein [bacterium]